MTSSRKEIPEIDPRQYEVSRRRFLRNAAVVGVGIPAFGLLDGIVGSSDASASTLNRASKQGDPFDNPVYKFTLVNHVDTNSFFTPTRYGAQDACRLLNCTYEWTGSETGIISQMVTAMEVAIAGRVDGIGVPVIDPVAFNAPVAHALSVGIPVVAYNSAAPADSGNEAMSYIGQDALQSGVVAGQHILEYVKKGDLVAAMCALPGSEAVQPHVDGAKSVLVPAGIDFVEVATSTVQATNNSDVEAWYLGHKDVKFLYGVDDGDGVAVADCISKYNLAATGVLGSGWDVSVPTLDLVKSGGLKFTIDQQAYLQGFLTIYQLFLYQVSGGLMRPVDTDTGLLFVDKSNVAPYLTSVNRYEGSSSAEKIIKAPPSITA
jgi:simple sugar transport system substrate-binding protein